MLDIATAEIWVMHVEPFNGKLVNRKITVKRRIDPNQDLANIINFLTGEAINQFKKGSVRRSHVTSVIVI